jgi:ABC-2 type transport system permease protein
MFGFSRIRLWQMIKKEFKQLLRDPKAKPLLLGSPIVQFILLAYASTTDVEHIRTVVVDQDRTVDSRAMVQAFTSSSYFQIEDYPASAEAVSDYLDRGKVVVGIIIPPGFSRDYRTGKRAEVQALIDGSDASVATVAQSYVGQVVGAFGARAESSLRPAGTELRARAWFNPELKSRYFNVPAIMGTLLIMTALMLTTMGVVREREVGTLDLLQVSPIKATELMVGKMVPILAVGALHLTLFMSLSLLHFEVPFRGTPGALASAAFLFLLAGLAIGLLISCSSKTQQEAFMLMILVMLPTVILSGMLSPIESMPRALQWLTLINPVRHFLDIVRGVFLKGTGLAELWPQYAALAAIAITALGLATNRFKHSIA